GDTGPGEYPSTPAGIGGVPTPPAGKPLRILRRARSRPLLRDRGPARCRRLLINPRAAVHVRFKLHVSLADASSVSQEQLSPGLQILVEALHQLALALLREINQNVHAKNAIELAHINDLRQVHGREGHHVADARLDTPLRA